MAGYTGFIRPSTVTLTVNSAVNVELLVQIGGSTPENIKDMGVSYSTSSNDTSIATIDDDGNIVGVAVGTTTVQFSTLLEGDPVTGTATVTVTAEPTGMRYLEKDGLTYYTKKLVDLIYPIGAVYISTNSTSPATLFGGTWEQIKDKFILSAGDTYSAGATGGEATHTLTTNEMPTHNHTFTGEAHNHGLNSHTHTYDKSATTTGAATGNTGSTAITTDQMPKHSHTFSYGGKLIVPSGNVYGVPDYVVMNGKTITTSEVGKTQGHTHTLNSHTHSITLTSTNSGAATGNTADATQGGTIGNAGSGNAHNNMPPYLAVYVWKRTA